MIDSISSLYVMPMLALTTLLAVGCSRPETATDAQVNENDWVSLMDGQDLSKFRGFRSDEVPAKWRVDDGALHFDADAEGSGGDLITDESFADFDLAFEWRISPCGNSGVMYRVTEDHDQTYFSGPEYQILDNTCHPDAENGPDRTAAANYGLHAPSADLTKPAGEWNESRIVVDGSHVEHWLNGERVVEYELGSEDWQRRVENSKFNEWSAYGRARSGHIAFQDHGDDVWYRNIRIREL